MFTLHNGDCLEYMRSMPSESVDIIVTDPPYSSGTRQATNRTASNIPKRGEKWARAGVIWDTSYSTFGLSVFMNVFMNEAKRILKNGAHIYTFIDWRQYPLMTLSVEQAGLFVNNCLIWDKGVYALGGNYRSQHEFIVFASRGNARELNGHDMGNVLTAKRKSGGEHPTEKPVELLQILLQYASNEGDTVFDPFMGSGSTGVAAIQTNRKFVGCEIEQKYYSLAESRIKEAVLSQNFLTPSNNRLHMDAGDSPRQPSQSTLEGFTPAEQGTTPAPRQ